MRYFENDVKEMFTNFGIKGDMLSTCMKKMMIQQVFYGLHQLFLQIAI